MNLLSYFLFKVAKISQQVVFFETLIWIFFGFEVWIRKIVSKTSFSWAFRFQRPKNSIEFGIYLWFTTHYRKSSKLIIRLSTSSVFVLIIAFFEIGGTSRFGNVSTTLLYVSSKKLYHQILQKGGRLYSQTSMT